MTKGTMKLTRKTAWSLSLAHALCRDTPDAPTTFASAAVQASSRDELALPRNRKYTSVGFNVVGGAALLVGVGRKSTTERRVEPSDLPDAAAVKRVAVAVAEDDGPTSAPPTFESAGESARGVFLMQDLSRETVSRIWVARAIVDAPDNSVTLLEVAASRGDRFTVDGAVYAAGSPFGDEGGDPFATYIVESGSIMAKITTGGADGPEELYFPAADVLSTTDGGNITRSARRIMEACSEALAEHRAPTP